MSIVPPLTTAKIKPTVSLGDKPIELESAVPGEGGGRERELSKLLKIFAK